MSNRGYSPEALERRKKQARERWRLKYATDEQFRIANRERWKKYYWDNRETELARSAEYYKKHREYMRLLGRTQCEETSIISSAIRDFKFGNITADEYNRRLSDAFARLDERTALERARRERESLRPRTRSRRVSMRRSNTQATETKTGRRKNGSRKKVGL
jgi:hypothetical protein